MANEVCFGWITGEAAMTFAVITVAGVARESGTAMTETPASSGHYLGTPTTIVATDKVIVSNAGGVIGFGVYQPQVTNPEVVADLVAIDALIDLVLIAENKTLFVFDEKDETEAQVIIE